MGTKNIKKDTSLRKAILQAAITGQLGIGNGQCAISETGKQLLERIIAERNKKLLAEWEEALKKNPKAKKPEPIVASEIDEDEIPFEIPENWCWCKIDDLFAVGTGLTPLKSNVDFYEKGNIPWVTSSLTSQRYVTYAEEFVTEKAVAETKLKIYTPNTLIVAMYGQGKTRGQVSNLKISATINQACAALECYVKEQCLIDFTYFFFENNYEKLRSLAEGTSQPNLNLDKIKHTLFPLPPLAVQNAIVSKLEQVLPLVEIYENAVLQKEELKSTLSDKVKKAILQEAVTGKLAIGNEELAISNGQLGIGNEQLAIRNEQLEIGESGRQLLECIIAERNAKALAEWEEALKKNPKAKRLEPIVASKIDEDEIPFEIPENWCWCRLGDICTKLVDGDHSPPAGLPIKTEYIMASSQNINYDTLVDLEKVRYLSKEVFEIENERTKAEKGDIFFTSVGTLGRSCVYDGSKNICFQRSVSILKTEIYNKFLKYCLDAPFIQYFIVNNATGTAQKGFYLNQLAKLVIPLPPLAVQNAIVAKIQELLPLCEHIAVSNDK